MFLFGSVDRRNPHFEKIGCYEQVIQVRRVPDAATVQTGVLLCWLAVNIRKSENNGVMLQPLLVTPWVQVACGYDHTVCITRSGSVHCFGQNKHGQCGVSPEAQDMVEPRGAPVEALQDQVVVEEPPPARAHPVTPANFVLYNSRS